MTDEELLARAERVIPGVDATEALGELRAALEEQHGRALIYEMVPPAGGATWLEARARLLSDYLDSRRYGPIGEPSVRVAVWSGSSVYVMTAKAFFTHVAERRGITLDALAAELHAIHRAPTN